MGVVEEAFKDGVSTSLLLIGPRGSGKSAAVRRVIEVRVNVGCAGFMCSLCGRRVLRSYLVESVTFLLFPWIVVLPGLNFCFALGLISREGFEHRTGGSVLARVDSFGR